MPKEQNIDDVRVLIEGVGEPLPTRIVIARKPEEGKRRAPNASARCAMRARRASSSIRAV